MGVIIKYINFHNLQITFNLTSFTCLYNKFSSSYEVTPCAQVAELYGYAADRCDPPHDS